MKVEEVIRELLIELIRVRKHVHKEKPTVTAQTNWLFTIILSFSIILCLCQNTLHFNIYILNILPCPSQVFYITILLFNKKLCYF